MGSLYQHQDFKKSWNLDRFLRRDSVLSQTNFQISSSFFRKVSLQRNLKLEIFFQLGTKFAMP